MPSAVPPLDGNPNQLRSRGGPTPPLSPFSIAERPQQTVSSPMVINDNFIFPSPSPENSPFSVAQPVSSFSSTSSSSDVEDLGIFDVAELNDHGDSVPNEPLDLSQECQGLFSFAWGGLVPDLGTLTSNVPGDHVVSLGQITEALTRFRLGTYPYSSHDNGYANDRSGDNRNGVHVSLNGTSWSPSQSIANLPHMQPSSDNIASLPPHCPLCTLPMPISIPPTPTIPIYTVTFLNPLHHSIFLLTSPPPPYSPLNAQYHEPEEDAGIYIYLSRADMYLHTHPGPLPEFLHGYVAQDRVGRLRGDGDEAIWLPTGAGGLRQDWLRSFWDVCRNMRMPPREAPGWREMFEEEDWVASVIELTKRQGIVVNN